MKWNERLDRWRKTFNTVWVNSNNSPSQPHFDLLIYIYSQFHPGSQKFQEVSIPRWFGNLVPFPNPSALPLFQRFSGSPKGWGHHMPNSNQGLLDLVRAQDEWDAAVTSFCWYWMVAELLGKNNPFGWFDFYGIMKCKWTDVWHLWHKVHVHMLPHITVTRNLSSRRSWWTTTKNMPGYTL